MNGLKADLKIVFLLFLFLLVAFIVNEQNFNVIHFLKLNLAQLSSLLKKEQPIAQFYSKLKHNLVAPTELSRFLTFFKQLLIFIKPSTKFFYLIMNFAKQMNPFRFLTAIVADKELQSLLLSALLASKQYYEYVILFMHIFRSFQFIPQSEDALQLAHLLWIFHFLLITDQSAPGLR